MDATEQSHLLSSITLMKELKDLIECQARALYGPQYPTGHAFDAVVSRMYSATGYEYEARLIAYTGEAPAQIYSEWTLLLTNPRLCRGPVDAMADLLEELYELVGKALGNMVTGDVYDGEPQA